MKAPKATPTFLRIWRLLEKTEGPLHYREIAQILGITPSNAHARLTDLYAGKYPGFKVKALTRGTYQRAGGKR